MIESFFLHSNKLCIRIPFENVKEFLFSCVCRLIISNWCFALVKFAPQKLLTSMWFWIGWTMLNQWISIISSFVGMCGKPEVIKATFLSWIIGEILLSFLLYYSQLIYSLRVEGQCRMKLLLIQSFHHVTPIEMYEHYYKLITRWQWQLKSIFNENIK